MLNAVCGALKREIGAAKIQHLIFMITRMARCNLRLELEQGAQHPDVGQPKPPVAILTFDVEEAPWRATLTEEPGEPAFRHPYDEDSIVNRCRVHAAERSIIFEGEEPMYTPIEVIVAMTNALHQALFPNAPGKWVFCRWDSELWPFTGPMRGLSVILTRSLGTRLTKSAVVSGSERVGEIYFSAKASQ